MGARGDVRIYLTGGVRVEAGKKRIEGTEFPGRLGRLAFAYLVVERDRPVPREELAETVWAGAPPPSWEKGTAVLVSKLRTQLAGIHENNRDLLSYAYGCYQLRLPGGTWIDTSAVAQATADAEAALTRGDNKCAIEKATDALEVARREFLPGEHGTWVQGRRDDLRRLRLRALDCLAEAHLKLCEPRSTVAAAREAVSLEPYRESGYVFLMRAHAAAGDRAEALRVHEECRTLLSEELGVDPSPETETVHLELLRSKPRPIADVESLRHGDSPPATQDEKASGLSEPGLAAAAAAHAPQRRLSSFRTVLRGMRVFVGLAAAVVVVVVLKGRGGSSPPVTVEPGIDMVGRLSESNHAFTLASSVGKRPTGVAVTDQFIWVINYTSQTLSWVDPTTGAVIGTRSVGGTPTGLIAGGGAIWVTAQFGLTNGAGGSVLRFDPKTADPSRPIPVGDGVDGIAFGAGAVWVTNELDDTVLRIDPLTNTVVASTRVGRDPVAIAVGGRSIWVANELDNTVTRIDAQTGTVTATIAVLAPSGITADASSVWVASIVHGSVTRIDPATDGVVTTLAVGAEPTAMSIDGGSVWVAVEGAGTIVRIDEATNRVVASAPVLGHPEGIGSRNGVVWVTVHA